MPGFWRQGRARNHGAAAIATALLMALAPAAMVGGGGSVRAQTLAEPEPTALPVPSDPYVQRGVPAEASAENAVVARERALAAGQRIAYGRMAEALGLPRSLPDSQIDALVSSIVIEQERVTPTRYAARITVNFNPGRVRGGMAGQGTATALPPPVPGGAVPDAGAFGSVQPSGPAVAVVDAEARYASLSEWLELRRRMIGSGAVQRVDVVTIAADMARLRLSLREAPNLAAGRLAQSGIAIAPADAAPMAQPAPGSGGGWRVGLAGRY